MLQIKMPVLLHAVLRGIQQCIAATRPISAFVAIADRMMNLG
jgi:hypothetical protein